MCSSAVLSTAENSCSETWAVCRPGWSWDLPCGAGGLKELLAKDLAGSSNPILPAVQQAGHPVCAGVSLPCRVSLCQVHLSVHSEECLPQFPEERNHFSCPGHCVPSARCHILCLAPSLPLSQGRTGQAGALECLSCWPGLLWPLPLGSCPQGMLIRLCFQSCWGFSLLGAQQVMQEVSCLYCSVFFPHEFSDKFIHACILQAWS